MKFGKSPQEIEHNRKVFLIAVYAIVGALIMVPLGTLSIINGYTMLGEILIANSVFSLGLMVYSRISQQVRLVSYLFAAQGGILGLFLVVNGGIEGTGIYYTPALALIMIMLAITSMRSGFIISFIFLAALVTGLYTESLEVYQYSEIHKSRIVIGLSCILIMALISEWMRIQSYAAISKTNLQLSVDANHDPLTKLLNRRGFEIEIDHMGGTDFPASLAVIDIDHFKKINDKYGHDAGDIALQKIAEYLKINIKGKDLVCRWGGEEFVVLFRHTSINNAETVLTQLGQIIRSATISHRSDSFHLTFSAGLAQLRYRNDFRRCINQADELLFQAKQSGRDRVMRSQA
jgi:diguanylate cyclase (GGDEF)-like protein